MKKRKDIRLNVIEELSRRYPEALTAIPHKIKPIIDDFEVEIFKDIGSMPRQLKRDVYSAISWYRMRSSYLVALISERGKVNIKGEVADQVTLVEKIEAREELKRRGLWTSRLNKLLKARTGRIEVTRGEI